MLAVVERRVPKGHHGVAHELVDGALLVEDDLAQRREQAVEKMRELLGVKSLGDRGKAAHVAEQQRHVALLAAKLEPRWVAGKPLHQGRRHIVAEGVAHAVPLALGAQEHEQSSGEVDSGEGDRGVDRIDQPAEGIEGVPGHADDGRDGYAAKHGAARRAKAIDQDRDEKTKHQDVEKLGRRGEVRPLEEGALQDLLDGLRVQLDARHRGFERRCPQVEQARGARADDGETAFDLVLADVSVQYFPGRQIAFLGLFGEPDPHLPVGLGRDLVVADAELDDAGVLAERLLAARA